MLHLGGIFMFENPVYPLMDDYDIWKISSHEYISCGQFAIVIDNKEFDKLL